MKQFILKIVLYGLCFALVELLLFCCITDPMSKSSHEANVRIASERIAQIDTTKIVIIGGSGCQFGFISQIIADHYNLPVINTGTHACIGLQLQINLFRDFLHPGDIVLLIPEYDQYCSYQLFAGAADESMLRIMISNYPKGLGKLSFKQWKLVAPFLPQYISKAFTHSPIPSFSPYSITAINEFGDATNWECRPAVFKDDQRLNPILADPHPEILSFLQDFVGQCKKENILLLLFPPALAKSESEQISNYIQTVDSALYSINTPFCVEPQRYILPDSLFYDTYYHMVLEGASLRTQMIVHDIDSIIGKRYTSIATERKSLY